MNYGASPRFWSYKIDSSNKKFEPLTGLCNTNGAQHQLFTYFHSRINMLIINCLDLLQKFTQTGVQWLSKAGWVRHFTTVHMSAFTILWWRHEESDFANHYWLIWECRVDH